jgi:hypothetical protein
VFRSILPATVLCSCVISGAWALPISATPAKHPSATNVTQVGYYDKKQKKYYKAEKKYYKKYYHGGKYWGHRYSYRPPGWQALGCVAVGPVWYCP